jgi:hypothetical protein
MKCENNASHNDDIRTEEEKNNSVLIIKLKVDLQNAINERNEAWFLLEENDITIP